jgi:gamma-carbonic anhydrase
MLARRLLRTVAFFSQNQHIEGPRKYGETFSRARNVMDLYNLEVYHEGNIFIAPNATIVGEVFLGHEIAIWHGTVLRGDINRITYSSFYSV